MKKTLAILIAALMLLSVCAASADGYKIPKNVKEIEGLPERPEIPTMTTKTDTKTRDVTVTLSAPLESLDAFFQWWIRVPVEFDEDGLVGTYSYAEQKSQPGTGTWTNVTTVDVQKGEWGPVPDGYKTYTQYTSWPTWAANWTNGGGHGKWISHYSEHVANGICKWVYQGFDALHGWSEIGYAYIGRTEDGIDVFYARDGKPVKASLTVEGSNYFGNDVEGTATITWKTQGDGSWFLAEIVEEYEGSDVAKIDAKFSSGGSLWYNKDSGKLWPNTVTMAEPAEEAEEAEDTEEGEEEEAEAEEGEEEEAAEEEAAEEEAAEEEAAEEEPAEEAAEEAAEEPAAE